jgi:phosphoglycerol transferase MdoB-like AlkP superfamily enzyme
MPQRELAEREQPALAQYYKSWGYNTIYVHPFQSGFYSRAKIYGYFGFEKMIYHDDQEGTTDFTVPVDHFGTYVDDSSVFNQILYEIKESDRPIYLHTTTMQNHQPYNQGDDPDDEFGNYLTWIEHTNNGLNNFLSELKKIDEPTLVFFVGDHFPSLRGETSVYNQLGLTGENCSPLYQQKYFFWSNYNADFSYVPKNEVSFFYIPYIILSIIDAPHDAFIEKMNSFMNTTPVYSTEYNNDIPRNDELDILTIDRVVLEEFSPSPIPAEELSTHD